MAVLYVCSLIYTDISFFFCNYTATAESYTYSHTLSLPDALPRVVALRKIGIERVDRARRVCRDIVVHRLRVGPQPRGPVAGRGRIDGPGAGRQAAQRQQEKRHAHLLSLRSYICTPAWLDRHPALF